MGDFHSVWEDTGGALTDITSPKFGASQTLFVRDRVAEIYQINGVFVLPTNRMSLPRNPFWWDGNPTTEQVWGLPPTNTELIQYCNDLGFNLADLETSSNRG